MENKNKVWELLAKRLAGEIGPEEQRELNALLKHEKEDINYMMCILENFNDALKEAPEHQDIQQTTHSYREALMKKIDEDQKKRDISNEMKHTSGKRRKIWIVAAAVLLLFMGGWAFLYFRAQPKAHLRVVSTEDGHKTKIHLPDSTEVWLNADSRLAYSNHFNEAANREVTLSGEAYFKVTPNSRHPFIIHTKYLDIRDIGTLFNVRAYPEEGKNEATLIKGAISVTLKEDPDRNLLLKPGEKITYYAANSRLTSSNLKKQKATSAKLKTIKKSQKLEVTPIEPVVLEPGDTVVGEIAWIHNQLIFNNETFSELAMRMSRHYHVNIRIQNDTVNNYSFTGIFEGESLTQALEELQMIRPFTFKIKKENVIINK